MIETKRICCEMGLLKLNNNDGENYILNSCNDSRNCRIVDRFVLPFESVSMDM